MIDNFDDSTSPSFPIESADDAVLKMFKGATFEPGFRLILPSGRELNGNEAQAFTSVFADDDNLGTDVSEEQVEDSYQEAPIPVYDDDVAYNDNPLSSRFDQWSGDPAVDTARLAKRAMDAMNRLPISPTVIPEAPTKPSTKVENDTESDIKLRKIDVIRRFLKRTIR